MEQRLVTALQNVTRRWVESHDWLGGYSWPEDFYVAPPHWKIGDDDWVAWFYVGSSYGEDDSGVGGSDYFSLTRFCAKGRGTYGVYFDQGPYSRMAIKKASSAASDTFAGTGFALDDGAKFFMPFELDAGQLAQAIADGSLEEGLVGLKRALEKLPHVIPLFDAVLKGADAIDKNKNA